MVFSWWKSIWMDKKKSQDPKPQKGKLLTRVPMFGIRWETALRGKGVNERWEIFKGIFLRVQELLISMCKKLGREDGRLSWLTQDTLAELKHTKKK